MKTFDELMRYDTFLERYHYAKLVGRVGAETFGFDRYINQKFYRSGLWKSLRDEVITRDHGRDLGIPGREIHGVIVIHHLNPITVRDIETLSDRLLDPKFLICTSDVTHNAIHYGDERSLILDPVRRRPGDTALWKSIRKD